MATKILPRTVLLLGLLAPVFGGCSGSGEPELSAEARPYANALRVSNEILERLKAGDPKAVYEQYLDPRLQQKATAEQFTAPMRVTMQKYGPIVGYKPGQYTFTRGQNALMKLIFSTKIVQHERGTLRYQFQFEDDGKYAKIVGVSVDDGKPPPKPEPQPPPVFVPETPK